MVPEPAPSAAPVPTMVVVDFLAPCHVMGAHMARHKWVRAAWKHGAVSRFESRGGRGGRVRGVRRPLRGWKAPPSECAGVGSNLRTCRRAKKKMRFFFLIFLVGGDRRHLRSLSREDWSSF